MPIFYSEPKNTNENNEIVDNRLNLGDVENIDTLYIVSKNVAAYAFHITGGGAGLTVPDDDVVDGKQYLLLPNISVGTGTAYLNIIGSGAEIEKVYLLEKLFEFPDEDTFIKLDMSKPERGAIIQEDIYYNYSKIKGYFKRNVAYTTENITVRKAREFERFRETYQHFYYLEDFDLLEAMPDRLYPALLDGDLESKYHLILKDEGLEISYTVHQR